MSEIVRRDETGYRLRISHDDAVDSMAIVLDSGAGTRLRFDATRDDVRVVHRFLGQVLSEEMATAQAAGNSRVYRHTDEDGDQLKIESWSDPLALLVHGYGHDQHSTSVRLYPSQVRELAGRLTTWLLEHDPSPARILMNSRCLRCGHTYGEHTEATSGPCRGEEGAVCDCLRWTPPVHGGRLEPAPTPIPARSEWRDFTRRREALQAAVTVWTAVDNIDSGTDAEDVIAWAQDFEFYLSTGETRVHPEPFTDMEPGPEHVPLPFTDTEPVTDACPDCHHAGHAGTVCGQLGGIFGQGVTQCGCSVTKPVNEATETEA